LKTTVWYVVALVALLLGGGLWFFNEAEPDVIPPKEYTALARAVDDCDAITEKAAAKLVAVVEFQKLEIAGRKANVFKTCMKDRGYMENPVWTKYAEPIAVQKAKAGNISIDEAFENLRRAAMMLTTAKQNEPLFWVFEANPN
jgi:hypothetical protein